MLGDPELIILDEPANGLDPEGMREIREIIRDLGERGKTIFLSSHLLSEVERTCTHVAIIQNGKIIRQDSVADVTSHGVAGLRARRPGGACGGHRGVPRGPVEPADEATGWWPSSTDGDLAALNGWLAGRGIHVSHLALEARSLEDVFMEATGATRRHRGHRGGARRPPVGGDPVIGRAFRGEMRKMWKRPATWVTLGLFGLVTLADLVGPYRNARKEPGRPVLPARRLEPDPGR